MQKLVPMKLIFIFLTIFPVTALVALTAMFVVVQSRIHISAV